MRRKLLAVCALVSLLFCLGTVWWWMGSGQRMTQVTLRLGSASVMQLWGCAGKLALVRAAPVSTSGESTGGQLVWNTVPYDTAAAPPAVPALQWTSFSFTNQPATEHARAQSALILPAWLIAGLFAFLPGVWLTGKYRANGHRRW
jgi:hypothetical protein